MEEYNKNILKKEIIKALKKSEQEIENGEGIESDEAFEELRKKYVAHIYYGGKNYLEDGSL